MGPLGAGTVVEAPGWCGCQHYAVYLSAAGRPPGGGEGEIYAYPDLHCHNLSHDAWTACACATTPRLRPEIIPPPPSCWGLDTVEVGTLGETCGTQVDAVITWPSPFSLIYSQHASTWVQG